MIDAKYTKEGLEVAQRQNRRGRLQKIRGPKPRKDPRPNSEKGLQKALERMGGVCIRCKFVPEHPIQLKFDHIDGNPLDNSPENLQLLCGNCHDLKTFLHQDYLTDEKRPLKSGRPYPVYPWRKEPLTNFHGNQHFYGSC